MIAEVTYLFMYDRLLVCHLGQDNENTLKNEIENQNYKKLFIKIFKNSFSIVFDIIMNRWPERMTQFVSNHNYVASLCPLYRSGKESRDPV